MDAQRIIGRIVDWAKAQPTFQAAAVVGSYARGTAQPGSDLDIVVLTTDPQAFRAGTEWHEAAVGAPVQKWQDEDYGKLWSRRLQLEQDNGEIEISFASPSWADVDPLDQGTRAVIAAGCCILHDPMKILGRLCAAVVDLQQK
jgi:uncharacterized protein